MLKKIFELKKILCALALILSIVAVSFVSQVQAKTMPPLGGSEEFIIDNNVFFFGDATYGIKGTVMPLIGYIFMPIAGVIAFSNVFVKKDKWNIVVSFTSFLIFLMCAIFIFQSKYIFITKNNLTPDELVSEVTHLTSFPVAAAVLSIAAGILSISYIFVNDREKSNKQ